MNTPSSGLLRKALKIVDEIEKLDQQMHHLLSKLQVKEENPSHLSPPAPTTKQKKKKVSQEKIVSPASVEEIFESKSPLPPSLGAPQHEQQSLLMEDAGIEKLCVVESRPSEMSGESGEYHEQSCCLF